MAKSQRLDSAGVWRETVTRRRAKCIAGNGWALARPLFFYLKEKRVSVIFFIYMADAVKTWRRNGKCKLRDQYVTESGVVT